MKLVAVMLGNVSKATKMYNNPFQVTYNSRKLFLISESSETNMIAIFKKVLKFFLCHYRFLEVLSKSLHSVLINFPNLEYKLFVCYPFWWKSFHVQQTCFWLSNNHDKLTIITLKLILILFYYSCIPKFHHATQNVYLKINTIIKNDIFYLRQQVVNAL